MKDGYFFRIRVFSIIDKYWDFQEKIKMICISFVLEKKITFREDINLILVLTKLYKRFINV